MPTGVCSECGQEEVMGPEPEEGALFVCCDCEQELATYNSKERTETQKASAARLKALQEQPGNKRCSLLDRAQKELQPISFDPQASGREIKVIVDPMQDIFAGIGASEVSPSAGALAGFLEDTLPAKPLKLLELGAGAGAVGIWFLKQRGPGIKMCVTDVPRLLPLLRLNCEANMALEGMVTKPLRWGLAKDLKSVAEDGDVWDWVIGADCCYNEDKSFPFMKTLIELWPKEGAIIAQSLHPTYGGRVAVDALQERANESGWEFTVVKEVETGVIVRDQDWGSAIIKMTPPLTMKKQKSRKSRYDENFDVVEAPPPPRGELEIDEFSDTF